jgi:molybdopterin biosynthesis enzyme MoaB
MKRDPKVRNDVRGSQLEQWLKSTLHTQEVVIFRDGQELTLEQVFQTLDLTAYDLSIDTLDMHAHQVSSPFIDRELRA